MHNFAGSCLTHIQRGRQNEQSHTLLHESFSQPSISPCASGCSEHGDDFTEHHDSERNWASHACLHSSYWAELHRSDFVFSAHFPRVKHELFVWNVFDPFFARKENSEEKPEAHCMGPSSATGSLTWVSLSVCTRHRMPLLAASQSPPSYPINSRYCMVLHLFILLTTIPVVPHKAVAEVSKIGNYRRGELL